MNEEELKNLINRQNILESIILVLFNLFKSNLDKSVRLQLEKSFSLLSELKR